MQEISIEQMILLMEENKKKLSNIVLNYIELQSNLLLVEKNLNKIEEPRKAQILSLINSLRDSITFKEEYLQ